MKLEWENNDLKDIKHTKRTQLEDMLEHHKVTGQADHTKFNLNDSIDKKTNIGAKINLVVAPCGVSDCDGSGHIQGLLKHKSHLL